MKKEKTVLEQIIAECRNAVLGKKPIICLRTNELEIIHRIIDSDEVVVRMSRGGPAQQRFFPTREIKEANSLKLFSTAKERRINFNIFNFGSDISKLEYSLNEYGLPLAYEELRLTENKKLDGFLFPCMYVFRAKMITQNVAGQKWENLGPFIDRYIQEKDGSAYRNSVLLIYGENCALPDEFLPYYQIVDEPYPKLEELKNVLDSFLAKATFADVATVDRLEMAETMLGLSLMEAERLIAQILNSTYCDDDGVFNYLICNTYKTKKLIHEQKKQILKRKDLLELVPLKDDNTLGGMKVFKRWIEKQKECLQHADRLQRESGASAPKGVLLCGIPGCGKSMAVQMVAKEMDLPLLKLDIGRLLGSYVGQSEHNMIEALKIAEAMSPCILFIDELDKGFSGVKKGEGDSGTFKRMFGTLLSWMQDCREPCFIFATANSIDSLPKEFFRSGRFDTMFSLFMPTEEECCQILLTRMTDAKNKAENKNLFVEDFFTEDSTAKGVVSDHVKALLYRKHRFVTGADISKIVNIALRNWWSDPERENVINADTWKKLLVDALESTTVYGDSVSNLNSIAVCYLQLLRNNFQPAADNPLFQLKDYTVTLENTSDNNTDQTQQKSEKVAPSVTITNREAEIKSEYDRSLYEVLYPKMVRYAQEIEKNALEDLLR